VEFDYVRVLQNLQDFDLSQRSQGEAGVVFTLAGENFLQRKIFGWIVLCQNFVNIPNKRDLKILRIREGLPVGPAASFSDSLVI
jgi:hypothetical protein